MNKARVTAARPPSGGTRFAKLARVGAGAAVAVAFGAAVWIGAARAQVGVTPLNVCDGSSTPQCQQVVASGTLGRLGTTGWALYCPANAPYWWNNRETAASRVTSFTENPFEDFSQNKVDFTITNWSALGSSDWAIAIDCSPINPIGTCTGPTRDVSDPGCPQSNVRTVCDGSDNCFQEWDETCVNGDTVSNYFCSQVLFATTCFTCNN